MGNRKRAKPRVVIPKLQERDDTITPIDIAYGTQQKYYNSGNEVTNSSALIDIHYAKLGLMDVWDSNRVLRLCSCLNITPAELASSIMLPHRQMRRSIEKNIFPGPVCILLTILENSLLRDDILDPVPEDTTNIIPLDKLYGSPEDT